MNKMKKDITIEDWLSPQETSKLIEALTKSEGWTYLVLTKNDIDKSDYYYINGTLCFKRNIKQITKH